VLVICTVYRFRVFRAARAAFSAIASCMTDAIFRLDGAHFVPSPDSCGPWSADRMHGGPVFGLIARAVEAAAPDPGLIATRFTFDLYRAVPLVPLEVRTQLAHQSGRLCLVRATLTANGEEYVAATALLLRESDGGGSQHDGVKPHGPAGLETQTLFGAPRSAARGPGYHIQVETRWVPRAPSEPLAIWFHMPLPLVEGEPTTALQRAVQLSDFANAVAAISQRDREGAPVAFINVDATLNLSRRPTGEWFCIQARSVDVESGISIASCSLYDERGAFGYATQSRLLNRMRR
jgi:Thioesterase-like superfamily